MIAVTVDNLIIGAGICGTYLASRQAVLTPNETTLLVDKMNDYGGNMINYKIPSTDITLEYGPIRFFPSIHPRIDYLDKKYNLSLTQYLPSSVNQIYYLRDKSFTDTNVFPDSDSVYNIRPDERFVNPFVTLENNLTKYIKNVDNLYLFERRIELFKDPYLSSVTFKDLAQGTLSEENWSRINDIFGYDDLFELRGSFLPLALENLILSNKSTIQYRFTNGFSELPITIATKNNLKTLDYNDFQQESFNCNKNITLFNTAILHIERDCSNNKWKVTIGKVRTKTPEQIDYTPVEIKYIYVNKIYSTIPVQYLSNIHKFQNYYNNLILNEFQYVSLSRFYLVFEEDWLLNNGIGYGKTVSTLDGGQFIHYDYKILQIYATDALTSKFAGLLPPFGQLQREVIPPNETTKPLLDELLISIKQTYSIDNLPKVTGISYCVWRSCAKFLVNRNLQSNQITSLYDTINNFMYPYGKQGNFYVIENAVSFNNTWAEGGLEMVDYLFNQLYGEPLFGEFLIK
jgi:hypothetical protein